LHAEYATNARKQALYRTVKEGLHKSPERVLGGGLIA